MKIAGKIVGDIGYNRAELTRADLTQADLTQGRVDPHSTKLADFEQLQADLDILQVWEITWDMQFNPRKCQVIHSTW